MTKITETKAGKACARAVFEDNKSTSIYIFPSPSYSRLTAGETPTNHLQTSCNNTVLQQPFLYCCFGDKRIWIAHFRVAIILFFKPRPSAKHSYGFKFYLHVKENSFSYEWFCTWSRFEKEAKND